MSANSSSSCNYCTYQVSTYGQNCDKCGSTCKTCTYETTTPATITSANSSRVCPGVVPAIVTGGLEYCYCPPMDLQQQCILAQVEH